APTLLTILRPTWAPPRVVCASEIRPPISVRRHGRTAGILTVVGCGCSLLGRYCLGGVTDDRDSACLCRLRRLLGHTLTARFMEVDIRVLITPRANFGAFRHAHAHGSQSRR